MTYTATLTKDNIIMCEAEEINWGGFSHEELVVQKLLELMRVTDNFLCDTFEVGEKTLYMVPELTLDRDKVKAIQELQLELYEIKPDDQEVWFVPF